VVGSGADALLLDEDAARDVPGPCPGLVTIGSTEKGDVVVLNPARTSALLPDGNPAHITEVCTSLALELGMSPWADDCEVEVVVIGFGEDLPQLLPTARIAHMRQPTHALRDLTERFLEAHHLPDTAWAFADVVTKAGDAPVTLVAPASTAAPHFPDAEILNASLSTPQTLDSAGQEDTVQRPEHAAYLQSTTALQVAAQPAHEAEGARKEVPDEPTSVDQSEQARFLQLVEHALPSGPVGLPDLERALSLVRGPTIRPSPGVGEPVAGRECGVAM
jgi:hypothetical protein